MDAENLDNITDPAAKQALYEKRLDIATKILSKRDDAVRHRAGTNWERIWREDEEMIDDYSTGGQVHNSIVETARGNYNTNKSDKSGIKINVVRNRCEIAEGRFCEILLPTEGKNWAFKTTPVPEMDDIAGSKDGAYQGGEPVRDDQGNHATVGDVTAAFLEEVEKKMKKMERVVSDQLIECDYNAEQRKCIRNAIRLGTGILKGPIMIKKTNNSWRQGIEGWELKIEEDVTPSSESLDPRNVYPDPQCGNDFHKLATYIWERDEMSALELSNVVGVPGYISDMIQEVLQEDPIHVAVVYDDKKNSYGVTDKAMPRGTMYQRWEYNGVISRKDLDDLGCDTEKMGVTAHKVTACIVFVNDKPIKAVLNTLDTNDLPYDFFPWTVVAGSPFGVGLPRRARDLQRVITAAWRKLMDNAGDSAGANIVMAEGIEPMDGQWTLDGKKAWRAQSSNALSDVRQAFAQFQLESRQPELFEIINLAIKFLDIETGIPQIFQGEMQKNPETLGQTKIIVDSSNIAVRTRVKIYDDNVTDYHLTRFYNYNMQYHPDEGIKGDYKVDSIGVSSLLERDTEAQIIAQLFQFKADPDINANTNWDKAIESWYGDMKISHFLSTPEEREAKRKQMSEAQPVDPAIQAAQIRAESQKQEKEQKMALQQAEFEFKKAEAQAAREESKLDRTHESLMKEIDRQIETMKVTEKGKIELTGKAATLSLQERLSGVDGKAPQVAAPVVEPVGKAPDDEAFQK